MGDTSPIQAVMVTGATGFVGGHVLRELLSRGLKPVCVVRSADKLFARHRDVDPERLTAVVGDLSRHEALEEAAELSQAAIHLVGIIIQRRLKGQTFARVHLRGTENVVRCVEQAGIERYVHISALGARPDAASEYQRTKWEAEECVRRSGLKWTILCPSLIHGPEGEFMRLMHRLICRSVPPMIPYFGSGQAKVQPVSVKDVAYCIVDSLFREETVSRAFPLGGPQAFSWTQLYNSCRALLPDAKHWKPLVSQPVPIANLIATLSAPPMAMAEILVPAIGMFRFDRGQVAMTQEDNVCDHTLAEAAFGIRMRRFEEELATYADQIG